MTSVRLGVSEEVCREAIMFHWSNVHDILSNVEYSKVKIKGFANFEVRKNFLKKQQHKMWVKLNAAKQLYLNTPVDRVKNQLDNVQSKYDQFLEIYLKYWKDETNQTDSRGLDE
jgi:hypothetical protein